MNERSRFKLEKIKLISGGGVQVKFEKQQVIGSDTYVNTEDLKSSKQPHPDLIALIEEMQEMVAKIFGFISVRSLVSDKKFNGDKIQQKFINAWVEEMISRINVTGVSISGSENTRGAIITATYQVDNKQKVAMNTPRILFSAESRGFEQRLGELVNELEDEAYKFCFGNKVSNPEIFEYEKAEN